MREIKEELGISTAPGRLLVVDWVPPRPGRTEGVMFVYDGGVLDPVREAGIELPAAELRSWAWSTSDQADSRLSDLLARRVRWSASSARSRNGVSWGRVRVMTVTVEDQRVRALFEAADRSRLWGSRIPSQWTDADRLYPRQASACRIACRCRL